MKEYQDGDENQITPTQEQNILIRENSDQAPHKKSTIPNIDEAILIAPILSALDGVKGPWGESQLRDLVEFGESLRFLRAPCAAEEMSFTRRVNALLSFHRYSATSKSKRYKASPTPKGLRD